MKRACLLLFTTLSAFTVCAQSYESCFEASGRKFNVNPDLLKAIAYTESRINQDAKNENYVEGRLVSTDYGVMQINDSWFPTLENYGVTPESIIGDACSNIEAGAWILANNFATSGEGWMAVGAYNAGYKKTKRHDEIRQGYIALVQQNLEILSTWEN